MIYMKILNQQLDEAFTRQHFELFAGMLKNISDDGARNDYAGRLVAMFEKDNPRFNKEQFLQAAGIDTADEKTELVYDETGKVHQIRPSEVDAFLQGHPGRGLAEGAVNEIWAPSKEIDDMEFPTTGVKDGWKKGDSEELVSSDWGSSDWTVAMEAMWDSLLRQHDGKVTPETMEAAAEEVIMAHGEQMGYDEGSFGEGVSQVISMFLNRQDGIKDSNMIGLANDTHRYAGKTKYMK